jgi:hypothetical protein
MCAAEHTFPSVLSEEGVVDCVGVYPELSDALLNARTSASKDTKTIRNTKGFVLSRGKDASKERNVENGQVQSSFLS